MSNTYQDLIRRLRQIAEGRQKKHAQTSTILDPTPPVEEYVEWKAADALEALSRQIKASCDEDRSDPEHGGCSIAITEYHRGRRDGERQGLERAKAEITALDDWYTMQRDQDAVTVTGILMEAEDRIDALITKEQSDGDKV